MGLRRFHFERRKDASGVSGCGRVAEGCLFTDSGQVVVHWLGKHSSINLYRCMEDVIHVHGHHGSTEIVFDDIEDGQRKEEVKKDGN